MRVLVCGSRGWNANEGVFARLDKLPREDLSLIMGDARGVDALAGVWCELRNVPRTLCEAGWQTHGRKAGPLRNRVMLDMQPDLVIAFRAEGDSPGTDDCVAEARRRGIPVEVIRG